jgi:hypothetical protein
LSELPEQMGSGRGQIQRSECLRHVVVEQDDKLEDAVEQIFVLM